MQASEFCFTPHKAISNDTKTLNQVHLIELLDIFQVKIQEIWQGMGTRKLLSEFVNSRQQANLVQNYHHYMKKKAKTFPIK